MFCGVCQRRMQGQHSNGLAYYRCRYPQEYALANNVDHPRNVILREDNLVGPLDTWLAQEFSPLQRRHTIAKLVNQAATEAPVAAEASDGPTVAQCDAKLVRYRAALDAGADPAVVTAWIAETQSDRERAQEHIRTKAQEQDVARTSDLTEDEVVAIVEQLGDMITVLRDAEPEHKLDVYRNLGLLLTYTPGTKRCGRKSILPSTVGHWLVSEGGVESPPIAPAHSASVHTSILLGQRHIAPPRRPF
ncbi:zinc ribbon domain-containing protein [Actinoplanes sp. NPDC051633]|uniref:zinc ribbon domain-containing protein n=1 Tax=Actinoplanes sp. NPDC051633 TaxID=3155670 RepID=UPI003448A310